MNVKTLNIALPKNLIKKMDEVAKKEYRNRSELIREAVRIYLDKRAVWEQIFALGEKTAREANIKTERAVNEAVASIRHGKKSK